MSPQGAKRLRMALSKALGGVVGNDACALAHCLVLIATLSPGPTLF